MLTSHDTGGRRDGKSPVLGERWIKVPFLVLLLLSCVIAGGLTALSLSCIICKMGA